MKVELTIEDLETILYWADSDHYDNPNRDGEADLYDRLVDVLQESKELEELNLDDCASGACKL